MGYHISVDAGGTFTEGVLTGEQGKALRAKIPVAARAPAEGLLDCLAKLATLADESLAALLARTATITWGTTLASDVLAAQSGAKVGTISTRGFRTRLLFARSSGAEPASLTVPHLMTEVDERVTADGAVLVPLDEESVREAVRYLKKQQVDAVAVLFLFSPLTPKHEQRVAEILAAEYPAAHVVLSSTVSRELRESGRWSRALLGAYLAPAMSETVIDLSGALAQKGFHGELRFRRADGGTATAEELVENPALLLPPGAAQYLSSSYRKLVSVELDERSFELRFHAGSEGREGRDGGPGACFAVAAEGSLWTDVEHLEMHCPVLVNELTGAADGEGAGKFRGGSGASLEFTARAMALLVAENGDASSQETLLFGPEGLMRPLRGPDRQSLFPGDRCLLRCSGGEGWGNPLERPTARVQEDVIEGYVSVQRARDVYGVVLNPSTFEVQYEATQRQRDELRARTC